MDCRPDVGRPRCGSAAATAGRVSPPGGLTRAPHSPTGAGRYWPILLNSEMIVSGLRTLSLASPTRRQRWHACDCAVDAAALAPCCIASLSGYSAATRGNFAAGASDFGLNTNARRHKTAFAAVSASAAEAGELQGALICNVQGVLSRPRPRSGQVSRAAARTACLDWSH